MAALLSKTLKITVFLKKNLVAENARTDKTGTDLKNQVNE
jgi:hypothetical protein